MDNNNMNQPEYNNMGGQQNAYQQAYQQNTDQNAYQQTYQQNAYQNTYQQGYQQSYQQGYNPNFQQDYAMNSPELEEPVSVGEWLITMLVMCVPCVNIIMMFVWAFSEDTKKSKSNFFKSALIWLGISMLLSFILAFVMGSVIASTVNYFY